MRKLTMIRECGCSREQHLSQTVFNSQLRCSVLNAQSQAVDSELNVKLHVIHKVIQQSGKSQANCVDLLSHKLNKDVSTFMKIIRGNIRNVVSLLWTEAEFDTVELHTVDVAAILQLFFCCGIGQQSVASQHRWAVLRYSGYLPCCIVNQMSYHVFLSHCIIHTHWGLSNVTRNGIASF